MALVRREIVIGRAPEDVWRAIGDPAAISTWFPGIATAEVNGTSRVITTASGLTMPEEIVTNDPVRRVFEYRITAPLLKDHLGSIDGHRSRRRPEPGPVRDPVRAGHDRAGHRRRLRERAARAAQAARERAGPAAAEEA